MADLGSTTMPTAKGSTITISLKALALLVSQQQQLSATTNGGGNINWRAVDTVVAQVSRDGLVVGRAPGTTRIIASARGVADTATVTVSGTVAVKAVSFAVDSAKLSIGQQTRPVVSVIDQNGASVVDMSGRTASWTSTAPAVATVDATGLVTAVAAGTANIVYAVDGVSDALAVTVVPTAVSSVSVTLGTASLAAGQTTQATAVARDASGNVLTGRLVSWSSSNTGVLTVSADGVVTAVGGGNASVVAKVDAATGSALASVTSPTLTATVATVTVSLSASSLSTGQTTQASATARDASGNVLTGRTVSWSSSNPAVATVSSAGVVTAVSAGSASIVATVDTKSGSAAVSATATSTTTSSSVYASSNFDNGSIAPFLNFYSDGVDVVDDPTGSGKGKVARFHYAGVNQDRNRSIEFQKKFTFGQSVYFKGEFYVASTAGMNDGAYQRKLLYWQPSKNYQKYPNVGGPVFFNVVKLVGNGLHWEAGYVAQAGSNVDFLSGNIATVSGNRWYTLEHQIIMNSSPSAYDGVVRIWLDGQLVFEKTNMRWTDPAWGGQPFGGTPLDWSDVSWGAFLVGEQVNYFNGAFDEYRYWDNVIFGSSRAP